MLKHQNIIRQQKVNEHYINQQYTSQQYTSQQYINQKQINQYLYPKVVILDIPNLEINKNNKNNKYNVNEIKKRINNTYYLKIIGLN